MQEVINNQVNNSSTNKKWYHKKKIWITLSIILLLMMSFIVYSNIYSTKANESDFLLNTDINNEYIEFNIKTYTSIKDFSFTLKAHTGLVTLYGWEKDIYAGDVGANQTLTFRYNYNEVSQQSGNKEIRYVSVDNVSGKIKNKYRNHKYNEFENNECKVVVTYDGTKSSIICTFTNLTNKSIKKINNIYFTTNFDGECELEVSGASVEFYNYLKPGESQNVEITNGNRRETVIKRIFVDTNVDIKYYVVYAD